MAYEFQQIDFLLAHMIAGFAEFVEEGTGRGLGEAVFSYESCLKPAQDSFTKYGLVLIN